MSGQGKSHYGNGDMYEGQFLDGKKHGKGRMIWNLKPGQPFLHAYEGDWKHDQMTGFGREQLASGDVYEGEFWNGRRHGKGRLVMKAMPGEKFERYYDGEWRSGVKQGHGREQYATGGYYDGEWLFGSKSGHG